ncbi:MAG: thymidine phosphorylase, partial [Ignavibacteria bacterium]|nr:thymidine phosphorylase [Ignavibacteria bacterium]
VSILEKLNVCMIGQTDDLTPADKKIYALRDVTATVENVGLITASITSKKIAEGSEGIVYDVKVGNGSTLPTYEKSKELASKLLQTSKDFGQNAVAVLTDMSSPLGYAIGNWVEIKECIEIMDPAIKNSEQSSDLIEVTLFLAGAMLEAAGKVSTIEEGIEKSRIMLESGAPLEKFIELVRIQGGDVNYINNPSSYPEAKFRETITAATDGFVSKMDALTFGLAAVNLGCGRKTIEDKIDYSSSILLKKKLGDPVTAGDVICEITGESAEKKESTKQMLVNGIEVSATKPIVKSRIIEVIN